jgi:hypothetical protein
MTMLTPIRALRANSMAAYPTHATRPQNRNYPPSRAGNVLMAASANRPGLRCEWCAARLVGKQVKYCGPACRSSASRRKHNQAMKVLADMGVPMVTARAMMKRFGLRAVEKRLNGLGWVYYPKLKAFYFDGVEASRRAA